MIVKIILNGVFPSLNQVTRETKKHWSRYSIKKKKMDKAITLQAMEYLKHLQDHHDGTISYPVGIEFKWFVPSRKTDPDNIAFAKKYVLDGLQKANIIANDNWKICRAFNDRFDIDKLNPRVEVTIYKIEHFDTLFEEII